MISPGANVFIDGKVLCEVSYGGDPYNLGETLRRMRTNWKEILHACKKTQILSVNAKFWLEDPSFVSKCLLGHNGYESEECKKLIDPGIISKAKQSDRLNKLSDFIEEYGLEERLIYSYKINWYEPYCYDTYYIGMAGSDFQYNHCKDHAFVRLSYSNFPWIPLDDPWIPLDDEIISILDNIVFDLTGTINASEITSEINRKIMDFGPISSGRHYVLACKKATEYMPEDPNNWWNYGVSLELAKRSDQAIEAYKKATNLTPENPRIWRILGNIYLRNNRSDDATKAFKMALNYLINIDREELWKEKEFYEKSVSTNHIKITNELNETLKKILSELTEILKK